MMNYLQSSLSVNVQLNCRIARIKQKIMTINLIIYINDEFHLHSQKNDITLIKFYGHVNIFFRSIH